MAEVIPLHMLLKKYFEHYYYFVIDYSPSLGMRGHRMEQHGGSVQTLKLLLTTNWVSAEKITLLGKTGQKV